MVEAAVMKPRVESISTRTLHSYFSCISNPRLSGTTKQGLKVILIDFSFPGQQDKA